MKEVKDSRKPKRTLEEAQALYVKAGNNPQFYDFLENLVGGQNEAFARTMPLTNNYVHDFNNDVLSAFGQFGEKGVQSLLRANFGTCIDVGTIIGRLMYEENLPEGLEEKKNARVN